jgi:hypothetical protein
VPTWFRGFIFPDALFHLDLNYEPGTLPLSGTLKSPLLTARVSHFNVIFARAETQSFQGCGERFVLHRSASFWARSNLSARSVALRFLMQATAIVAVRGELGLIAPHGGDPCFEGARVPSLVKAVAFLRQLAVSCLNLGSKSTGSIGNTRESHAVNGKPYCPAAASLNSAHKTLCCFMEYIAVSAARRRLSIPSPFWG